MDTMKGVLALAGSIVVLTGVAIMVGSPRTAGIINAFGATFGYVLQSASAPAKG